MTKSLTKEDAPTTSSTTVTAVTAAVTAAATSDEKEKEKEQAPKERKEPEPNFEILNNPARVLRQQLKVYTFFLVVVLYSSAIFALN